MVTEIADRGNCVIVGRGANWFLRNRTDAFHAFLYAPYDEKMRRTIAQGETEREAANLLESVDRERAGFRPQQYYVQGMARSCSLYNLMMNTKIGDEAAVTALLNVVDILNERQPAKAVRSA